MARSELYVTLELDLVNDALAEIVRIRDALARRHGERFRDLDRRIEGLGETVVTIDWHDLGPCHSIAGIPHEMAEIINRARELGV